MQKLEIRKGQREADHGSPRNAEHNMSVVESS